jgi:hypothetical protein
VYVKSIKVTDLSSIAVNNQLQIKFTGLLNPKSVKPIINDFQVKTYTKESYPIDKGTISNAADLTIN